MTFSTPRDFSSCGRIIPPTELTQSIATVNPAFLIAFMSTRLRARIRSICFFPHVSSCSSDPVKSFEIKSKSSLAAISRTFIPSRADKNSPFSLSNFKAFHSAGLWLAVIIIPPSAYVPVTASSTVGVVAIPRSITFIPRLRKVVVTRLFTIIPDLRASRPTTTLSRVFLCLS